MDPPVTSHLRPRSGDMRRDEDQQGNRKQSPRPAWLGQQLTRGNVVPAFGASQRIACVLGDTTQIVAAAWAEMRDPSSFQAPIPQPRPCHKQQAQCNKAQRAPGASRIILIPKVAKEADRGRFFLETDAAETEAGTTIGGQASSEDLTERRHDQTPGLPHRRNIRSDARP